MLNLKHKLLSWSLIVPVFLGVSVLPAHSNYELNINDVLRDIELSRRPSEVLDLNVKGAPVIEGVTFDSVSLSWNRVESATSYKVQYGFDSVANSNDPNATYAWETPAITDTSTTIASLKNGVTYYFSIVASDKDGNESDVFSEESSAITGNEFTNLQPYIRQLNIDKAWGNTKIACSKFDSMSNCSERILPVGALKIAVIDDGVNMNHPDFNRVAANNGASPIWTNAKEIPGNAKDDDKNGYVDDYNGWNFIYENNNTLPLGSHGTAVSGIISAVKGNGIGIDGILVDAQIMSIGVLGDNGRTATGASIIRAIDYAIENGADIINLSLGGSQFSFSGQYDQVIKKAYSRKIPIVISAGNGDELSENTNGVNTSINKISPVCNDLADKKMIFGIGSLNKDGTKSVWSNYGNCVDFWAPGEDMISLSVLDNESKYGQEYNKFSGTSFSAPVITGIIGLGIRKVGKVPVQIIYDSLSESSDNGLINADKFITILVKKTDEYRKSIHMNNILETKSKVESAKTRIDQSEGLQNLLDYRLLIFLGLIGSLVILSIGTSFYMRK